MADPFVVTGSRPPSVAGLHSHMASSKDFGYYTRKPGSSVDETLFRSSHTSPLNAPVMFKPPWESKPKGKDGLTKTKHNRPLLWAPSTTHNHFIADNNNNKNNNNRVRTSKKSCKDDDDDSPRSFGTIHGIPMRHQYRPLKHTPTFVDETLFGDPLSEPSFKAPWEEKKKVKQLYNWYPDQQERKPIRRRRPATALGLRSSVNSGAVPVWKP
ncbi:RBPJ-interacting and tubulin-associated protein 1-like [Littorina saxatilis]|uniref:RBPJ-interacting and tubulin-associated protein 1 n=1 Tax=Littorina saxatilis TaxID=31220 RepID=A0AAN9AS24_9CAEN